MATGEVTCDNVGPRGGAEVDFGIVSEGLADTLTGAKVHRETPCSPHFAISLCFNNVAELRFKDKLWRPKVFPAKAVEQCNLELRERTWQPWQTDTKEGWMKAYRE